MSLVDLGSSLTDGWNIHYSNNPGQGHGKQIKNLLFQLVSITVRSSNSYITRSNWSLFLRQKTTRYRLRLPIRTQNTQ